MGHKVFCGSSWEFIRALRWLLLHELAWHWMVWLALSPSTYIDNVICNVTKPHAKDDVECKWQLKVMGLLCCHCFTLPIPSSASSRSLFSPLLPIWGATWFPFITSYSISTLSFFSLQRLAFILLLLLLLQSTVLLVYSGVNFLPFAISTVPQNYDDWRVP